MVNLVFLGSPGAGKGTYASRISHKYSIPAISSGDLLRAALKSGSELGKQAKSYMDQGELVPDKIIDELLRERIKQPDAQNGFILDGYPRNVTQAETLTLWAKIDRAIFFVVPERVLIDRLGGRKICSKCGFIYHLVNIPPTKPGVCDKCGGALYTREDDKPAAIKHRLKVQNPIEVVEFYRTKGILREVDASGDIRTHEKQIIGDTISTIEH